MAQASTIKSFLVGLGFDVDASSERKFTSAIETATLKAKLLGDGIEGVARRVMGAVEQMASGLAEAYRVADRSNTSVKSLRELQYVFEQLGLQASSATALVESFASKLRTPGNAGYLKSLGVDPDSLKDSVRGIESLFDALEKGGLSLEDKYVSQKIAEILSVDEKTYQVLAKAHERRQIKPIVKEYDGKVGGLDLEKAGRDAVGLEQTFNSLGASLKLLGDKIGSRVFSDGKGPLQSLLTFLEKNGDNIADVIARITKAIIAFGEAALKWLSSEDAVKFVQGIHGAFDALSRILSAVITALGGFETAAQVALAVFVGSFAVKALAFFTALTAGVVGTTTAMSGLFAAFAKLATGPVGAIVTGLIAGFNIGTGKGGGSLNAGEAEELENFRRTGKFSPEMERYRKEQGLAQPGDYDYADPAKKPHAPKATFWDQMEGHFGQPEEVEVPPITFVPKKKAPEHHSGLEANPLYQTTSYVTHEGDTTHERDTGEAFFERLRRSFEQALFDWWRAIQSFAGPMGPGNAVAQLASYTAVGDPHALSGGAEGGRGSGGASVAGSGVADAANAAGNVAVGGGAVGNEGGPVNIGANGLAAIPAGSGGKFGSHFNEKAPSVMQRMMKEFGLTKEQAAGAVGWLGGESGLDPTIVNKVGGDTGYAQWTNVRRAALYRMAGLRNGDASRLTDENNWNYLKHELTQVPYFRRVIPAMRRAKTAEEAARTWGDLFEGARGTPKGLEGNLKIHMPYVNRAMGLRPAATPATSGSAAGAQSAADAGSTTDIERARVFLRSGASGGALRTHAIDQLHPAFALRLESALKEARASGLPNAGLYSAYRRFGQTGSAYDSSGYSSHSYGGAVDVTGIGGPGSQASQLWNAIAGKHGIFNPYGAGHRSEWNHYQLWPQKLERDPAMLRRMQQFVSPGGPIDLQKMWEASGVPIPKPAEVARKPVEPFKPSAEGPQQRDEEREHFKSGANPLTGGRDPLASRRGSNVLPIFADQDPRSHRRVAMPSIDPRKAQSISNALSIMSKGIEAFSESVARAKSHAGTISAYNTTNHTVDHSKTAHFAPTTIQHIHGSNALQTAELATRQQKRLHADHLRNINTVLA